MHRIGWFFLFLIISCSGYSQRKIRVLFVGNSLTYSNNLPELVKNIAAADDVDLDYTMLALPDYALIDHINDGYVITDIQSQKFDFVIVQQGPSSQQVGRTMLLNDGSRLAKLCRDNNARLGFYTVWPSKARSQDFPRVIESYRMAAQSSRSILLPAGDAWLEVWKLDPECNLYSEDNFHPNYKGSLLAALVIYGSLSDKKNLEFIAYDLVKNSSLSKSEFKILKQAAQHVLK